MVRAIVDYDPTLPVLGLPGSAFLRLAEEAGLHAVTEAFADRAYTPRARSCRDACPGAVLDDPEEIARRCVASPPASRSPTSTAAPCVRAGPSACTATPRAPSTSPAGSGPRSPTPASPSPRSSADARPPQRHHRAARRARRPRGGARPLRGAGGRRADGRGRHGAGGAHPAAGHRPGTHLPVRGRGRGPGDGAAGRPRRLGRPRRDPGDLRRRGPRRRRRSCSAATSPSWYAATRPPSGPWRSAGSSPASATSTVDRLVGEMPRRSSPRKKVPAGSVALAGEFGGVYPRESPGGWQLIGRTAADPVRPRPRPGRDPPPRGPGRFVDEAAA